jgi:hypothetical protein
MRRHGVHKSMEVEYYHAQAPNHHLAGVRLIYILSLRCGGNIGGWCKHRHRSMSFSSKDTVDEDPWFVSRIKCLNNIKHHLNGDLCSHIITSRLTSEKAAPQFTFSKIGSYHSLWISLILLHSSAKYLVALSTSTSLGSRKALCIWIQLVTVILLHPHKTLLHLVPDLWLSVKVKFVSSMNSAFSLDTDPMMSLRGTRTRASTNKWDMSAEHPFSCPCDDLSVQSINQGT